uniref:Uncharacterized protein n=1 Tax=Caenorhabditis tropicalis TaxID=1561998 RepID=A0A1I7UQ37_9PELO
MEHMHTQKFTSSWKTWSGARMLRYVELSNFIEFRCKAEDEEAKAAKERHIRKSTHVQTDPTESSKNARRTLPRTLPSTPNTSRSPSTPLTFYPTYPSPNSLIGAILEHKSQIVTVGNNYLLVLDNRSKSKRNESLLFNGKNDVRNSEWDYHSKEQMEINQHKFLFFRHGRIEQKRDGYQ